MKSKTVIFDLDGTLAQCTDRLAKAQIHSDLKNKKFDWNVFRDNGLLMKDTPHPQLLEILKMYVDIGYRIIIVTGRPDYLRDITMQWLAKNNIPGIAGVYMRKADDHRQDSIIKKEILDNELKDHDIHVVYEDRARVVDMWRENGITCFQVAKGDF